MYTIPPSLSLSPLCMRIKWSTRWWTYFGLKLWSMIMQCAVCGEWRSHSAFLYPLLRSAIKISASRSLWKFTSFLYRFAEFVMKFSLSIILDFGRRETTTALFQIARFDSEGSTRFAEILMGSSISMLQ